MIFDGGREDWEAPEMRGKVASEVDAKVGSVIAVVLALIVLITLLAW